VPLPKVAGHVKLVLEVLPTKSVASHPFNNLLFLVVQIDFILNSYL
jgi:hypothetical protein